MLAFQISHEQTALCLYEELTKYLCAVVVCMHARVFMVSRPLSQYYELSGAKQQPVKRNSMQDQCSQHILLC